MVQDLYQNPVIGSQLLYFHKPDKDAVFAVPPDANNKPVNEDRNSVRIVDNEPAIKILENGDVRFRYYAPNAKKVEVAGCGGYFSDEKQAMTKGEDGWWSVAVSGIKPGFHNHKYWVDGNLMVNPDAPIGYGWFYPINIFDLPGEEDEFWMLKKDVPHGSVRMEYYRSSVTGRMKCAWVYCPAGYDDSEERYPVLYIQHGVGENEMGWVWQGHLNLIADNLIAEGKAEKQIIVMNCGYAFLPGVNPTFFPGDFDTELTADCIPHIDAAFRTIADRKHRAIAGLSLGSSQAFAICMKHRELFANLGVFSGGFPIVRNEYDYTEYFNDAALVNRDFDILFFGAGDDEGYAFSTAPTVEKEQKIGVNVTGYHHPGFHVWDVWRFCAREFLQRIFRTYKEVQA